MSWRGRVRDVPKKVEKEPPMLFPLMSVSEIVSDLRHFDYTLSEEAVRQPMPEGVHHILMFFLNELYGVEYVHALLTPSEGALDALTHPEIYEEGLPRYHLLRAFRTMLEHATYKLLRLDDLMAPSGRRYRWQLSALLNLAKYRRAQRDKWEALCEAEDEMRATHAELKASLEGLNETVAEEEQALMDEEPELEKENARIKELEKHIVQLKKKRDELQNESVSNKSRYAEMGAHKAALEDEANRIRSEVVANKELIVDSPQRIMGEIDADKAALARIREDIKALQEEREEVESRERRLYEALPAVRQCEAMAESLAARAEALADARLRNVDVTAREFRARAAHEEVEEEAEALQRAIDAIAARRRHKAQTKAEASDTAADDRRWADEQQATARFVQKCEDRARKVRARVDEMLMQCESAAAAVQAEVQQADFKHTLLFNAVVEHEKLVREAIASFEVQSREALLKIDQMYL